MRPEPKTIDFSDFLVVGWVAVGDANRGFAAAEIHIVVEGAPEPPPDPDTGPDPPMRIVVTNQPKIEGLAGPGGGGDTQPTIGPTFAGAAIPDNAIFFTGFPFGAMTTAITEADGENVFVTVTLSDSAAPGVATDANGVFTVGSLGLFNKTGPGTYLLDAGGLGVPAAAATAALQNLIFDATDNQVAPGGTVTTQFAVTVEDLDGNPDPVTDSTATVIATSINDPPALALDPDNSGGASPDFPNVFSIGAGVPVNLVDADATLTDPDAGLQIAQLTARFLAPPPDGANEILAATPSGGADTIFYNPATLTLTVSASGGLAAASDFEAVLRSLTYFNAAGPGAVPGGPRVIEIQATDSGGLVTTQPTSLINVAPLQAADAQGPGGFERLTPLDLSGVAEAAIERWAATGTLSSEDLDSLHDVGWRIENLPDGLLAGYDGSQIWVDDDAAGWGWFADATPHEDSEFAELADHAAAAGIDLLTVAAHELGHVLGLPDSFDAAEADDLMYGYLNAGERRVPGESDFAPEPLLADVLSSETFELQIAAAANELQAAGATLNPKPVVPAAAVNSSPPPLSMEVPATQQAPEVL